MVLSSWNTLEVGVCSMWHNSGLVQAGVLGHSQDQREEPSPSTGLAQEWWQTSRQCRGQEGRRSRYPVSVFDGRAAAPVLLPALLHPPRISQRKWLSLKQGRLKML